jgi:hypothetical protein
MPGRQGNGLAPFTPLLSTTTDSSGVATFPVPAGTCRRYDGCLPVVVAPVASGRFAVQVISEPTVGSKPAPDAVLTIRVGVSVAGTGLGGVFSMAAAPAGITVRLMLVGV